MTTFAEMETNVITITKRPDLVNETKLAIKQATAMLHGSGEYYPDLINGVEATVLEDSLNDIKYVLINEAPFIRFSKPIMVQNKTTLSPLDLVDVETLFDSSGFTLDNVYYMAGTRLNIRSSSIDASSTIIVTYLQKPLLTEAGYNSWIANDHSYIVESAAAAYVFEAIGNKTEAVRMQNLVAMGIRELQRDYLRN